MHIILIFCLSSLKKKNQNQKSKKSKLKQLKIKQQQIDHHQNFYYISIETKSKKPENIYYYSYITLIF